MSGSDPVIIGWSALIGQCDATVVSDDADGIIRLSLLVDNFSDGMSSRHFMITVNMAPSVVSSHVNSYPA